MLLTSAPPRVNTKLVKLKISKRICLTRFIMQMKVKMKTTVITEQILFKAELDVYYDYLDSLESFLDKEKVEHHKSLDLIQRKFENGELQYSGDPNNIPGEYEYDYWRLDRLSQFENILRSSFFVNVYALLESTVIAHYKYHSGKKKPKDGLKEAIKYLNKVTGNTYDTSNKNSEFVTIDNYRLLRNTIVHNEGIPQKKRVSEFIIDTHGLSLEGSFVKLDAAFCREALDKVISFLESVLFGKPVS